MIDMETVSRSMLEPVVAVDSDSEVTFANRRFLEIGQFQREGLLGADVTSIERIVDAGFDDLRDAIETVSSGESDERRVELSMDHPEAAPVPRRLPAEARVTPVVEDESRTGSLVVLRNIHERKERETELQQSHRRFEAVFNSPDSFIGVLNPDGTLRRANETALEFAGVDLEDVRGEPFWETPWWNHSADLQRQLQAWIERAASGEHVRFDTVHYAPDGEKFNADGVLRPVTNDDGAVVSLVAEARDITERKRRERELERQNRRLDEFASVVSHDLRNPLNVAQGRIDLARETRDSDHLEHAADALDRMESLIDDLLTLAREGNRVTDPESVDLAEAIDRCWGTVETADARLERAADVTIRADPGRLKELLENLLRNAVEHGGDDVTVTIGTLDDGFYVADDGPGIPEDERDRIFEAGFSSTNEGTGLGLQIVEQIADAHEWDVTVTDSEAGGARFEVTNVAFE